MTIVINVQTIRHCHGRTYTAALKDLAISINVLCPSVTTSSFPFNNLAAMWYCVSFYLQLDCQSTLLCRDWTQWDLQAPFSPFFLNCAIVGQMSMFVLRFFFPRGGLHSRLSFSEARKSKFISRLSHPRGSFFLSWIMATITEDIGLGCACFIKLKVLCRMQNKLV